MRCTKTNHEFGTEVVLDICWCLFSAVHQSVTSPSHSQYYGDSPDIVFFYFKVAFNFYDCLIAAPEDPMKMNQAYEQVLPHFYQLLYCSSFT